MDQSTLNYVYYEGKLKEMNVKINDVSQIMAFGIREHSSRYDAENKVVREINSDCSPVVRHKMKGYF